MSNAGFELGLADWNTFNGEATITSDAFAGNNALALATNRSGIDQGFSVVAGETYTLSGYGKTNEPSWSGIGMSFYADDWTLLDKTSARITSEEWDAYTVDAIAPTGAVNGILWAWKSGDTGITVVDELMVSGSTPPPPPPPPAPPTEGELLGNPGFEDSLAEWNTFRGSETATTTDPFEGNLALELSENGSGISQSLDVIGGEAYQLNGYAKYTGNLRSGLGLDFWDASWTKIEGYSTRINSADWQAYEITQEAPANAAHATVWSWKGGDSGSTFLDALSLQIVADPPVNQPPVITSNGGVANATLNIAENSTSIIDIDATDPDGDTEGNGLSYTLEGPDISQISIDPNTGELSFNNPPDFETANDSNGDNAYEVNVVVFDAQGGQDNQLLTINVTDVDETPPDTTAPTASLTASDITTGGAETFTFSVSYTDDSGVDPSTLDNRDIQVVRADRFIQQATLVSTTNGTATYRIIAPGGTWNSADNGTYTVQLLANQVSDVNGNAMAATTLGTFDVSIDSITPRLINGSFEANDISDGFRALDASVVPGWQSLNGELLELWDTDFLGVASSDGTNHMELDYAGSTTFDGIYQDLQTTAGEIYELTFDLQARGANFNSNDEAVVVEWNGETLNVEGFRATAAGEWTTITAQVVGTGNLDRLTFRESRAAGASNGTGPFLDNTRLREATSNAAGSEILVRAQGNEGTEEFDLLIDGQVVQSFNATSTDQFETFAYFHRSPVAPEDVRIQFTNDQLDPSPGIDTKLIVDFVSIDGKAYQTESPAVFSTGTWRPEDGVTPGNRESETLDVNGYFQFADTSYLATIDAEGNGEWSDVEPLGLIPIHSMVLPDGKVFSFGTDARGMQSGQFIYSLYDPETGVEIILPNTTDTDVFCSNMSIDPVTGNILITGGDARGEGGPVNGPVNDVVVFDYANLSIRDATQGEMDYARWYGSSITLPNGEIMVMGGTGGGKDIPEIFNAQTGWRTLTGVDVEVNYYYPKTFVTSDGSVVVFSADQDIYRINTASSGSSQRIGTVNVPHQSSSPAVMYDVDKVAVLGSDSNIYTMDLSAANPTFELAADTLSWRRDSGMSVLPDGRVLLTGGSRQFNVLDTQVKVTEIWDPRTNEVTQVESLDLGRLYHSTHILLPNGTVWAGGGGAPGPLTNLNVEFFAPDYLYDADGILADRPVIVDAPLNADNSSTMRITVEDSAAIDRITAVRTGAHTHAVNNDTRFVELNYRVINDNTIEVTTLNANIMVPGTWMLFAVDGNGTPSEAAMLGVGMVDVIDTEHFLPGDPRSTT